jgi:carbonic anhydrase
MLPERLKQGYATFRAGRYSQERERYRKLAEAGQRPSTMIIACCDSRAAPETVFDAGPGELFVVRNVANLVPPYAPDGRHHSTSAALEFAVLGLEVHNIVVMGHGRCGGIATLSGASKPLSRGDFIGAWMAAVHDVAEQVPRFEKSPEERLRLIERASVEHSLANLRTFPWIRTREAEGMLTLHGAWFDIALGVLEEFDPARRSWAAVAD